MIQKFLTTLLLFSSAPSGAPQMDLIKKVNEMKNELRKKSEKIKEIIRNENEARIRSYLKGWHHVGQDNVQLCRTGIAHEPSTISRIFKFFFRFYTQFVIAHAQQ